MDRPHAVILFAHGSRDPLWHRPMHAVRTQIERQHPALVVRCAYLELSTPDLASTVAELEQLGIGAIRIVPMFLGTGRHAREDLPRMVAALAHNHPALTVTLAPPIGENERLIALMADIAVQ